MVNHLVGTPMDFSEEFVKVISADPLSTEPDVMTDVTWRVNQNGVTVAGPFPLQPEEGTTHIFSWSWTPTVLGEYRIVLSAKDSQLDLHSKNWVVNVLEQLETLNWLTVEDVRSRRGRTVRPESLALAESMINSLARVFPSMKSEFTTPYRDGSTNHVGLADLDALLQAISSMAIHLDSQDESQLEIARNMLASGITSFSQHGTSISVSQSSITSIYPADVLMFIGSMSKWRSADKSVVRLRSVPGRHTLYEQALERESQGIPSDGSNIALTGWTHRRRRL